MILLIDNFDSFVHNLSRYFQRLGQETLVLRNNAVSLQEIEKLAPDAIVLSPGPCSPDQAGICLQLVNTFFETFPILGICLGHQTIAQSFGAKIIRAPKPVHGQASQIFHESAGIFAEAENPFLAARYHSLILDPETVPEDLKVTAKTEDGLIMGIQHREYPVYGLQFHPESILTETGFNLLDSFLKLSNLAVQEEPPSYSTERKIPSPRKLPDKPITF